MCCAYVEKTWTKGFYLQYSIGDYRIDDHSKRIEKKRLETTWFYVTLSLCCPNLAIQAKNLHFYMRWETPKRGYLLPNYGFPLNFAVSYIFCQLSCYANPLFCLGQCFSKGLLLCQCVGPEGKPFNSIQSPVRQGGRRVRRYYH